MVFKAIVVLACFAVCTLCAEIESISVSFMIFAILEICFDEAITNY
jgi:hypothetical protein